MRRAARGEVGTEKNDPLGFYVATMESRPPRGVGSIPSATRAAEPRGPDLGRRATEDKSSLGGGLLALPLPVEASQMRARPAVESGGRAAVDGCFPLPPPAAGAEELSFLGADGPLVVGVDRPVRRRSTWAVAHLDVHCGLGSPPAAQPQRGHHRRGTSWSGGSYTTLDRRASPLASSLACLASAPDLPALLLAAAVEGEE